MKKTIVIAIFVLFLVNMANAQVLIALLFGDKLTSEKFEMGIRIAENFSNMTNTPDSKMRPGFAFGIYGIYKLNEKFDIQADLFFNYPVGAKGIPPAPTGDPNLDPLILNADVTTQLAYFALPVIGKYNFENGISVGIGPQIGLLRSAKNKYVAEVFEPGDLVFKDKVKSQFHTWDFGLVFDVGYKLQKKRGVHVILRYYLGLTDIVKDDTTGAVKNSVLQIAVGIPMGKKETDQ
ncbi:MAG: PorT family protein [Candidatus Aminicenantes bacterium]|nr:PorT family protein [Candidatus Aminicenantes bacterium]